MTDASPLALLAEAALPRTLWCRAILAIVILRFPVIWLCSWLVRGEPIEVTATFRPNGDIQYFEIVAALAQGNFGESNLYETAGEGLHPFPLGSITVHALFFAVFGAWGLMLADTLAAYAYYCAVFVLARTFTLPTSWAAGLGGAICANLYVVLWPITQRLGWSSAVLWGDRFPRPLVTETFFVSFMTVSAILFLAPTARRTWKFWAVSGIVLALSVQSDIYGFFVGTLLFSAACLRRLLARAIGSTVRGLCVMVAVVLATTWPFALQRASASPELLQRWGAFPLSRWVALSWITESPIGPPLVLSALALVVFSGVRRFGGTAGGLKAYLTFWVLAAWLAWVAMPLFFTLIGQGLYTAMFPDRLHRVVTYGTLIVVLLGVLQLPTLRLPARATRLLGPGLVAAMVLGVAARAWTNATRNAHVREYWFDYSAHGSYRDAFAELVRELEAPRYRDAVVMATVDHQVHTYWQAFRGGRSFVPDSFVSIASDAELERRLMHFSRILGMSTEDFLAFAQDEGVNCMFLGLAKYAANDVYAMAPLRDYTPEQVATIRRRNMHVTFRPIVPISELERLRTSYESIPSDTPYTRLDIVVLGRDRFLGHLAPPDADFDLTFENSIFRVFLRREATAEAG